MIHSYFMFLVNKISGTVALHIQLSWDLKVASTEVSGLLYDSIVHLVGLIWNAKNYIFDDDALPEAGS